MDNNIKPIKVYISGALTNDPGQNAKFGRTAVWLNAFGVEAVNPVSTALYSRKHRIDRALEMLRDCDMICMIPGWQASEGARLEHHYAEVVGMPEFTIPEIVWREINEQGGTAEA